MSEPIRKQLFIVNCYLYKHQSEPPFKAKLVTRLIRRRWLRKSIPWHYLFRKMEKLSKVIEELDENSFMASPISPMEDLKSMAKQSMMHRMEVVSLQVQADICKKIEQMEGKSFKTDRWEREEGGGFVVCIMEGGKIFERVGITVAVAHGKLPPPAAKMMKTKKNDVDVENTTFYSASVSCVIHATNPHVPATHFNFRYFEAGDPSGNKMAWFGGVQDLTPYYIAEEDIVHFHKTLKDACDKHNKEFYPKFKKWSDQYFFNPFRGELRGVGGIFFDDLDEPDLEACFEFISSCCDAILPSYFPIVEKNMERKYTDKEKQWMEFRRGRYVEFNLVCDRGTKFGFSTPGVQVDAFLITLPLTAMWRYKYTPEEGSEEEKLVNILKAPRDWA